MDLNRDNRGLALVFSAYNVLAALVWVLRSEAPTPTIFMVGLHLGLAWLLQARSRAPMFPMAPWFLWLLAWIEIGWLYRLTGPEVFDGVILRLDQAVFGRHLNETLPNDLPWAWLREVMGLSYLSYYLLILVPPVLLALRRRNHDLRAHTTGLLSTYLACFAVYLILPVLGPRAMLAGGEEHAAATAGVFSAVMQAFFAAGDSLGTAFPSSHCAASMAAALLVRRHFGPLAGAAAGVWAGMIVMSTIYTNNHYGIDALAGVLLALATVGLVLHWLGHRRDEQGAKNQAPGFLTHEGGWS